MDITIREATTADLDSIVALLDQGQNLHIEALPGHFRPFDIDDLKDWIGSLIEGGHHTVLLAESESRPIGFVQVHIEKVLARNGMTARRHVHVHSLMVDAAHRRRGVGRKLMAAAEEWARAQGVFELVLMVYEFNQPAIDFYEELGYGTFTRRMTKPLAEREPAT